MPPELTQLFAAVWGVAVYALGQPWIGPLVGGVVGGYALASAKNRTAIAEVVRAVVFGGMAWFAVVAVQAII